MTLPNAQTSNSTTVFSLQIFQQLTKRKRITDKYILLKWAGRSRSAWRQKLLPLLPCKGVPILESGKFLLMESGILGLRISGIQLKESVLDPLQADICFRSMLVVRQLRLKSLSKMFISLVPNSLTKLYFSSMADFSSELALAKFDRKL